MTEPMNRDEKIAAYLDGQMDDAAMAVFEAEMERDQALADAVARFAGNDALLRDAFEEPLGQGTDDDLKACMGLEQPVKNTVDPFPGTRKAANENGPMLRRWRWPIGGAIAAALTLAVLTQFNGSPQEDRQFADAMETLPSRSVAQLSSGQSVTPVLSFQAGDGRYCREYVRSGSAERGSGIACRSEDGWKIEGHVNGHVQVADGARIETAAGADPTALDSVYSRLQASDPLNDELEKTSYYKQLEENGTLIWTIGNKSFPLPLSHCPQDGRIISGERRCRIFSSFRWVLSEQMHRLVRCAD